MRIALLALCFSAAAADFAPAGPGNRRNSEADALVLRDGRILFTWIEFQGDGGSDWAGARLSARISSDQGQTWGEKFTLQENIGTMNVMEPDLLRLKSGKVLFLFCRKNSPADCAPMVRISKDDAKTFTPPVPMAITPSPSYTGFNHDRAIQLRGGRILMPVFFTTDYRVDPHIRSRIYYSDDEGHSWKPSETVLDLPGTKHGAQEPGVIELKDGRVMVWVRTELGRIYRAYSKDKGRTFSELQPIAGIESPLSPQSIKRHPGTGDLILFWNNSPKQRTPLATAISRDEGRTWEHHKVLDETPGETFAYTSVEWLKEKALISYYAAAREGTISLRMKTLPLHWFYE
ncbi:MAG TPA: sialidase family protein [Bryobacteraceae bacterium]|nr:sialidase family protein [Bryobacteraceae bacterium]